MAFENIPGENEVQEVTDLPLEQDAVTDKPDPLDLGSVERFKFEGKEWTPHEFKNAYLMQQDYTRKTQALSEEKRKLEDFERHWAADQETLLKNPDLITVFKEKYPKQYHKLGEMLVEHARRQGSGTGQVPNPQEKSAESDLIQRLKATEERISKFESSAFESQVSKYTNELNTRIETLSKKYPYADQEVALVRAQGFHQSGQELNDQTWEGIFKKLNDQAESNFKQYQSKLVNEQKTANAKARDVASGGGTPGAAPSGPRTIRDATKRALSELQ